MEDILKQIAALGPTGLAFAYLIWDRIQMGVELRKVNEARIMETRQCLEALHATAKALDTNTRAIEAMAHRQ